MSQNNSFNLNPAASEFVPSFGANPSPTSTPAATTNNHYGQQNAYQKPYNGNNSNPLQNFQPTQHNNGRYQNNHHQQRYNNNNNYPNQYNGNYRNNNHNGHHNGGGYGPNTNNHYNNHHHHHNQSNHYQGGNGGDCDAIEIEARCEAVIEILQDDKIRNHLNPVSNFPAQEQAKSQSHPSYSNDHRSGTGSHNDRYHSNDNEYNDPGFEDEEEMLEMLEMQEECRLEMMKFYIQSQNPALFEEVYHDVSYPGAHLKKMENSNAAAEQNLTAAAAANTTDTTTTPAAPVAEAKLPETSAESETSSLSSRTDSSASSNSPPTSETQTVAQEVLVPENFAQLNLNDEPVNK